MPSPNPDAQFRGVVRMSQARFEQVLRQYAAPGVLAERPLAEYYQALVDGDEREAVDPAFALAIFQHESGMGRAGIAQTTHSWGNTRLPSFGLAKPVGSTKPGEARSGVFPIYAGWLDGLKSTKARLLARNWYYWNRTIGEVFRGTATDKVNVWAPAGDLNDPAGYLRGVLDFIDAHADRPEGGTTMPTVPVRVDLIPPGSNRPQTKLRGYKYFVIHETDNENAGAGAQNTLDWLKGTFNNGVRPDASFHYVADGREVIQLLPLDELGWHIGDGADEPQKDASFYACSVEICVNSRAAYPTACSKAASVVAAWLKAHNLGLDAVRQHGSFWSPENSAVHVGCPKHLKAGDWGVTWQGFLNMVAANLGTVTPPPPPVGVMTHDRLAAQVEAIAPAHWLGSIQGRGYVMVAGKEEPFIEWQKGRYHAIGDVVYTFFVDPNNPVSFQALERAGQIRWV